VIVVFLTLTFLLAFLSGFHWCAYQVEKIEGKCGLKYAAYSLMCGAISFWLMIIVVGKAVNG
jgi:hypothetical protein